MAVKRSVRNSAYVIAREWPLIEAWREDDGVYVSVAALFEPDDRVSATAAAAAPEGSVAQPVSPPLPTRP
jgi:hypothetical protein